MKTIALFFGGLSNETEVSIMSAKNVIKYFDYQQYQLILIYWHKIDRCFYIVKRADHLSLNSKNKVAVENFPKLFDVALLMTHGRYGEDGVLQAILESQKIKYCGCRVLASALCLDKVLFKNIISSTHINQVKFSVLDFKTMTAEEILITKNKIRKNLQFPVFVKPANSGSSLGITRVTKHSQLELAIKNARKHDSKILIEEGLLSPQEVEVAILGNKKLIVSQPGELRLAKDFYNYDDKYKLGEAQIRIPANISSTQIEKIKILAVAAYRLTNCQGFARVDFFVVNNKIYLNEINTLPGFTDISMFPKLMFSLGIGYQKLLNKIIRLAY